MTVGYGLRWVTRTPPPRTDPLPPPRPKRLCPDCSKPLNSYTCGPCGPCVVKASEKAEQVEVRRYHGEPVLAEELVAYLPANVADLMFVSGRPKSSVREALTRLEDQGRVYRVRVRGGDFEYRRVAVGGEGL